VICFQLSISELGALRNVLERGLVDVGVFDQEGRQLLSRGTLVTVDNTIGQGNVRLRATFSPHSN
jgi:hypothetical protein